MNGDHVLFDREALQAMLRAKMQEVNVLRRALGLEPLRASDERHRRHRARSVASPATDAKQPALGCCGD